MPTPLFVVAPIRPSVCVPCHEELETSQFGSKDRIARLLGRGDPVARIARVGVPAVAVVRRREVAAADAAGIGIVGRDHVVAGDHVGEQIGVVEAQPRVEHGDDDAGAAAAAGHVPGLLGIDRRRRGVGERVPVRPRRLEVPLADRRTAGGRRHGAAGIERIVRRGDDVLALVDDRVFDVGQGTEPSRQAGRAQAAGGDDVGPVGNSGAGDQRHADPVAERLRLQGAPAGGRHRLLLHHLRVGPVLDDHPGPGGIDRGGAQALRHRRLGGQRQEHRGGKRGKALVQSSHFGIRSWITSRRRACARRARRPRSSPAPGAGGRWPHRRPTARRNAG